MHLIVAFFVSSVHFVNFKGAVSKFGIFIMSGRYVRTFNNGAHDILD